ncbi:MAG: hypothetical protein Q4G66_12285, partial [bacterium]|nr:hypothetical protein [bacterium]
MKGRFLFFLIGLLPFLFPDFVISSPTQKCEYFKIQIYNDNFWIPSSGGANVHSDLIVNASNNSVTSSSYKFLSGIYVQNINVKIIQFRLGQWILSTDQQYFFDKNFIPNQFDNFEKGLIFSRIDLFHSSHTEGCSQEDSCNKSDSDNDGVCDYCDTKPGEQDPQDCIIYSTSNRKTGVETSWTIDPGCSGNSDNYEYYESSSYTRDDYFDMYQTNKFIPPKNCYVENGMCGCRYPHSDKGPGVMSPDPNAPDTGNPGTGDPGTG